MTNTEPQVIDTGRYSHNQTCAILKISSKTLYRHSENGSIQFGLHPANGRRFYTGRDIKRYWKAQE